MEYDIINEIITGTIANLFQPPFSVENPYSKSNVSLGLNNQSPKLKLNQLIPSMSSESFANDFPRDFQDKNIPIEINKTEQKQEINRSSEIRDPLNKVKDQVFQKSVESNLEPVSVNQTSFNLKKMKEGIEYNKEHQPRKENTAKTNLTTSLTSEQWIQINALQKLNEALERLNLNTNNISKVSTSGLSAKQLEAEKKNVKNELKRYDASFTEIFKRMPNRAEKEPMRPLYIYYKKIKQGLSKDESEEKVTISEVTRQQSLNNVSVDYEKNSGNSVIISNFAYKEKDSQTNTVNSYGRRIESSFEQNINHDKIFETEAYQQNNSLKLEIPLKTEKKMSKEETKKKLEILNAIKTTMRDKLHNYQIEFTKNNNRKIKYHKDIIPVEEEYKRYKEVKEEISILEEFLKS